MTIDRLRIEANERLDLQDLNYLAKDTISGEFEQVLGELFCSPTKNQKWILDGFAISNPSAKQVRVDRGRAILAQRRDGITQYGILATIGEVTRILDLNTYTPAVYGIYIRFEEIVANNQSRIFWNPAGSGSEYTKIMPIRYEANWSLKVERSSPGTEWLKIGEVDQATMAITDQRNFYFEGAVDNDYESGWSTEGGGNANDRDADRAVYGVKDLQTALASLRQGLEDIRGRGLRKWYEKGIGGLMVGFDADPFEGRLGIGHATLPILAWNEMGAGADAKWWAMGANGGGFGFTCVSDDFLTFNNIFTVQRTGYTPQAIWHYVNQLPQNSTIQQLGDSSNRWNRIFGNHLYIDDSANGGVENHFVQIVGGSYNLGLSGREWDKLYLKSTAGKGVYGDLVPTNDVSFDLGNSDYIWSNIWGEYTYGTLGLRADHTGDGVGIANYTTYTGENALPEFPNSGNPKTIIAPLTLPIHEDKPHNDGGEYPAGWLRVFIGVKAYWFPLWEEDT